MTPKIARKASLKDAPGNKLNSSAQIIFQKLEKRSSAELALIHPFQNVMINAMIPSEQRIKLSAYPNLLLLSILFIANSKSEMEASDIRLMNHESLL